jgi:hypothetical protein
LLHGRRIDRRANTLEQHTTFVACLAENAHLDQFVRAQIDVDFTNHRRRQPVLTDADDGMQMMRLGAKLSKSCGCDRRHAAILAHTEAAKRREPKVSVRPAAAPPCRPISA